MISGHPRSNPTVEIPPWDCHYWEDTTAHIHSVDTLNYENAMAALQRYLPSNNDDVVPADYADDFDVPVDAFSCDDFRMFEFKVKKCAIAKSHDWTECPFAHPGEKARRRDPRKYHYSGSACPDFRKGECVRGDACEYAHGVFELWLHPARYRTQPCKDGTHCRRRVCFFAHTSEQLRVLPYSISPDPSPSRLGQDSFVMGLFGSSLKSTTYCPPPSPPTSCSSPVSPSGSVSLSSFNKLSESMRRLRLNKMKMDIGMSPPSWGIGCGSSLSPIPGFVSLPSSPIRTKTRSGLGAFVTWGIPNEEEPMMERVESGRELRERIYAKLGMENSLHRGRGNLVGGVSSELGWDEEHVK